MHHLTVLLLTYQRTPNSYKHSSCAQKSRDEFPAFLIGSVSRPETGLHIEGLLMETTPPSRRKRTQRDYSLGSIVRCVLLLTV